VVGGEKKKNEKKKKQREVCSTSRQLRSSFTLCQSRFPLGPTPRYLLKASLGHGLERHCYFASSRFPRQLLLSPGHGQLPPQGLPRPDLGKKIGVSVLVEHQLRLGFSVLRIHQICQCENAWAGIGPLDQLNRSSRLRHALNRILSGWHGFVPHLEREGNIRLQNGLLCVTLTSRDRGRQQRNSHCDLLFHGILLFSSLFSGGLDPPCRTRTLSRSFLGGTMHRASTVDNLEVNI
jgi:hypothetical protein